MLKLPVLLTLLMLMLCNMAIGYGGESKLIRSPDNHLQLEFLIDNGVAKYRVFSHKNEIIAPSKLGFEFSQQPALTENFVLVSAAEREVNESWKKLWGQSKQAVNHYRELTVKLIETTKLSRQLEIVFRVYNDGVAFRYQLPLQPNITAFAMTSEQTEFTFTEDLQSWWTPADYDSYEALYQQTPLTKVQAVNTPITFKSATGQYFSIHEAALTNYAGMTLVKSKGHPYRLVSDLVPWPDGIKVKGQTPFNSPWRTIQVADNVAKLIESDLIVNLNEPSVVADTSWIKPMKYLGIWWGMHMRKYTWQAGPKHGATTENTKAYMDFAAQHNIGGVLVEGWNQGWESWHSALNVQDFTKAYRDFDLKEIVDYGKQRGVALIGHHETGGNIPMYEKQMDKAFKLYQEAGVHAIKTGYAGHMVPEGMYHHGQQMVSHYRKVLEMAAKHQIMVNAHEPIKPTGLRRTYPNMMTREGARGMEWNGWSAGNPPEHTVTLPFTRLLAGPLDYTPGIFNILFDPQQQYRIHSTLARQLAMYVVLYSPLQMAADMIENYHQQPAFEFIEKVPTTWDETRVLTGEIGDYIITARRAEQQWFIGSMTDEQPRLLTFSLDFLAPETTYLARIFADANNTSYQANPTAINIQSYRVKKGDKLSVALAGSGGHAMYLTPVTAKPTDEPLIARHNQQARDNFERFKQAKRYGEIETVDHLAVNKPIKILSQYDESYSAGGDNALVDGIIGGADYQTLWQGYREKDLDVVIDLGAQQQISSIEIEFLQSVLHSILLPSQVRFALSSDGERFSGVGELSYQSQENMPDYQQKRFSVTFNRQAARYIRVQAKNLAKLPSWHIRAGQECFIFADEIIAH
ncbi:hypothetical protein tinsulaeT_06930 [Thalassotalea insulae]|uniref:Alpha-glucosidase n=1 Tax=Thalassotalea insulae TaxID=2056778 RepID=A0ABQ6GMY5_9GAMM|nr:glycoside hydrolase family 97 catalytic domain-containing protein [Thalassotalea insulae]GLX77353.1 hypothetical protein tinsulaeT_06930 [Thalassotalea insulae]